MDQQDLVVQYFLYFLLVQLNQHLQECHLDLGFHDLLVILVVQKVQLDRDHQQGLLVQLDQ